MVERAMNLNTVQEIERAIGKLTTEEWGQLCAWLDEYHRPQPIDLLLESDLESGRIDKRIQQAVDDYKNGRTQPL